MNVDKRHEFNHKLNSMLVNNADIGYEEYGNCIKMSVKHSVFELDYRDD